jgi:hypothetical protein
MDNMDTQQRVVRMAENTSESKAELKLVTSMQHSDRFVWTAKEEKRVILKQVTPCNAVEILTSMKLGSTHTS